MNEQSHSLRLQARSGRLGQGWVALLAMATALTACGGSGTSPDETVAAATAPASAAILAEGGRKTAAAADAATDALTDLQALRYIASYADLIGAMGANPEAGRVHYRERAAIEGRSISFDPDTYLASYPELIASFGIDAEAATRHYISIGQPQGRQLSFDAWRYLASYDDLMTSFGADTAAATRHYITRGYSEGRVASFDALRYLATYPDLVAVFGTDTQAATRHFVTQGRLEGRKPTFDALRYNASYADLARAFSMDAAAGMWHYITRGYMEGRRVLFDAWQYVASYGDLVMAYGSDVVAATRHYLTAGVFEGRQTSFDANRYLTNYADLQTAFGDDVTAATFHYLASGYREGRTDAPMLTIRARGSLVAGVGPTMAVRINDSVIGTVAVQSTTPQDYTFVSRALVPGAKVEVVFNNDATAPGEDRNLFVQYLTDGRTIVLPTLPGAVVDRGSNQRAFDGLDLLTATGDLYSNGALRLTWPAAATVDANLARKGAAARLLLQATFGPTPAELERLVGMTDAAWVNEQLAMPVTNDFVPEVQRLYDLSANNRPGGSTYDSTTPVRRFWATAAGSPDQLRKRVAFALHQIFMVSQADSNLYDHTRAYANYLDTLNRQAFGNFRNLLEDISLSPVMGIYLSHIRNRKENPATGQLPDENYAREVMQLFTIGLQELNIDGTLRLDGNGKPIDTYNNADVMALAKVFTGWSWAFPDGQLTDSNFRYGNPKYTVAGDTQMDLLRMKAYPGQHSTSEKPLFAGKPSAVTIPANTSATESLRIALDTLFNHPNVGPFIGRQLIQRLTTSNPSPAYVARVATVFNNNGQGVRGDLGAVVRAILLDPEARQAPAGGFGKLKEPILRVANWMRAFGATSATGNFLMVYDLDGLNQRPYNAPSVFSYFRPGYIPPNTTLAEAGATAPEFQIVNESTTPTWVNLAENMAGGGIGWTGTARDVVPAMSDLAALSTAGNIDGLIQQINLRMFGGRMPRTLRQDILDSVTGVGGTDAASHLNRARVAVFVALSSPEFLVQR